MAIVAFYGMFLSTGLMKKLTQYQILMAFSLILFSHGGVMVHLLNTNHLELY